MLKENKSQEFILKNIKKTKNNFIEKLNKNKLMSEKHENVFITLNHIEPLITLASVFTWSVPIAAFASSVNVLIQFKVTSSAVELNICAITPGIKNYKSIIKKIRRRKVK